MKRLLFLFSLLFLSATSLAETVWQDTQCGDGIFIRGDTQGDGFVDNTDGVNILNYLYNGWQGWCEISALDVDASGTIDDTDAINLLNYLNNGTWGPPPAPYSATAGGANCSTVTYSDCRHSPIATSPVLTVGDAIENNIYPMSCADPQGAFIWPWPELDIQADDQTVHVEIERNRECYQTDACTEVALAWDVEDAHYTTQSALAGGLMKVYTSVELTNIKFTGEGDSTFCVGNGDTQHNILKIHPDAQMEYFFYSLNEFGNPSHGLWILDNHGKAEADQPMYRVYQRQGEFFGDPGLPGYGSSSVEIPGPVSFERCYGYDPADEDNGNWSVIDDCDLLKLVEVRIRIPLRHLTFDHDIADLLDGETERVEFDVILDEVRYEFPHCGSLSPNCQTSN